MKEPVRQQGEGRGLQGLRITPARSVAFFLLAVLLFNPPLLLVFDQAVQLFGLPLLFVYLFASWGLIIVLIALGTRQAIDSDREEDAADSAVSERPQAGPVDTAGKDS
ncbi:hypothetical protein ACFOW6_18115 [Fodinicurvata halophila]|uniref:DUF3311 domain-containing protein n=1 Tax=Fodinicurvata halophila TaxID=1419723 RepID=A0ABV8UQA2_9PROT